MKYYMAQVDERNGEYENSTTIIILAKSKAGADKTLTKVCKTWYCDGDGMVEDNGVYHFNCDEVSVYEGSMIEISEQAFKECYKLLSYWGLPYYTKETE